MRLFLLSTLPLFMVALVQSQSDLTMSGITYENSIKPIFSKSCSGCHNGRTPLSNLLDYDEAFEQRFNIKNKILTKEMPHSGHFNLTETDKDEIVEWINTGARR